jgi:hypothetical protein
MQWAKITTTTATATTAAAAAAAAEAHHHGCGFFLGQGYPGAWVIQKKWG